jgi:cell wall-associated NlpC family hydrolase
LHRGEEKYLDVVEKYMAQIDPDETPIDVRDLARFNAQPGDVLMFRVGRTFSHGAIVTQWPFIIHAYYPSRMVEEVDIRGTPMAGRPVRLYSYWGTGQ